MIIATISAIVFSLVLSITISTPYTRTTNTKQRTRSVNVVVIKVYLVCI